MNRRDLLKSVALGAAATAIPGRARAENQRHPKEFFGVLVDTTRCIGCRTCEIACATAHDNPVPDVRNDGALEKHRTTSPTQFTVVNRYKTEKGVVFVKRQCMHCWQPACAAACLTNAMLKTKVGPVIWRGNKCMGCRFCMVSCPFDVPKFEYNSWNPRIRKCDMCWDRLKEGKRPACVEACPTDALMFGKKKDLMEIARTRVYRHPSRYYRRIYGEHEVGGTGWLYLASVPFDKIGFRTDLGTTPYPQFTREFLYAVPIVFFSLPAFLMGLSILSRSRDDSDAEEEQ